MSSGSLAPSKSTVYVGNLPFTLTNNDVHQVFEKFGKIVKVTILRDKYTRQSKGVAFIQYIDRSAAINACKTVNQKQLFERKIKCVIAADNGRATEFMKKKEYPDKSTCYECSQEGHLSYCCPNNFLGDRDPPPKKEKKERKRKPQDFEHSSKVKVRKVLPNREEEEEEEEEQVSTEDEGEDPRLSSLSSVIQYEAEKYDYQESIESVTPYISNTSSSSQKKRKIKKSSYFSDEEEFEDD